MGLVVHESNDARVHRPDYRNDSHSCVHYFIVHIALLLPCEQIRVALVISKTNLHNGTD